jgi:hypothetical protein
MPGSLDYERRRNGGLTDEQIERVASRVSEMLEQDDSEQGLCARVGRHLERRIYEWVGRKFSQWLLLLAGAGAAGAWVFVQYLKTKGVI